MNPHSAGSTEFYHLSSALPLTGDAKNQLTRASRSIVLNLAEGRGKPKGQDQVRFFNIAMGSLRECQAILELECLTASQAGKKLDHAGASLYRLISKAL
jgi:four helix bundle protein